MSYTKNYTEYDDTDAFFDALEWIDEGGDEVESFEHFFKRKKGRKKGGFKAKFKKIADKVKGAVKDVASKLKDGAKAAALLPLVPAMKVMLKKKRVSIPNGVLAIGQKFYKTFINKSYEEQEMESFDPASIGIVVSAIIKFFKNQKAKKDNGERVTSAVGDGLAAAARTAKGLVNAAKTALDQETKAATKAMNASIGQNNIDPDDEEPKKKDDKMIFIIAAAVIAFVLLKKS